MAILQLAIYELLIEKKEPPKVIIDEAVELAKEFGSEKSYAFVNAVLGKVYSHTLEKS
jgi:N utilization substance protein B